MRKNNQKNKTNATNATFVALAGLVSLTTVSGLMLASTKVFADDIVDDVAITVPISCTISGTGQNSHTAEVPNGTYQANIGTTTMNVLCNDASGFSIYAAGFTGEEVGGNDSNKLVGTEASSNAKIVTGTATTAGNPDISNWAMKLATDSEASYPLTLTTGYNAFHEVPNEFTKVATRLAGTDVGQNATGSTLTSTYAAYISKTQVADTYSGKVKYVLVHPNDGAAPTTTLIMQDVGTWSSSVTAGQEVIAMDARDNKTYTVARLADGNLWMTQNLDHDISTTFNYTNENTDIGYNIFAQAYDTTSWNPISATHNTNDKTWGNSFGDAPESYDPGELYWNGETWPEDQVNCESVGGVWNNDWCNYADLTTSTGNMHYHLGNYYNWLAAVAMDNFNNLNGSVDVNRSICPSGWRLPTNGINSKSFQFLVDSLNLTSGSNGNIQDSPTYFVYNGLFDIDLPLSNAEINQVGFYGGYWSSAFYYGKTSDSYLIEFNAAGSLDAQKHSSPKIGLNIRCVAR